MSVIFILIPLSIVIATGFLLAFVWAVKSGQYEDTCTPSMRLLLEEAATSNSGSSGLLREGAKNDTRGAVALQSISKHEAFQKP